VSSYALKMSAMLYGDKNNVSWTPNQMAVDFIGVLKFMVEKLSKSDNCLPWYWDHQANLMANLSEKERENVKNYLKKQVQVLEQSLASRPEICRLRWKAILNGGKR
jgi:hypothetical protein